MGAAIPPNNLPAQTRITGKCLGTKGRQDSSGRDGAGEIVGGDIEGSERGLVEGRHRTREAVGVEA